MSSPESSCSLSHEDQQALLRIASDSIRHGLDAGTPLRLDEAGFSSDLQATRATFVTLQKGGNLRGCIGSLEARQPLAQDVADNAFSAAFRDPRFPPLHEGEFEDLEIHISILTPSEPMTFVSEEDLVSQLRPGVDGLIMEDGFYRGTFLPSVWEQLPDPQSFLTHLKLKSGLPTDYWSDTLKVSRYRTEMIP
jgi:AmmeMemoRadiSam system protein A